jgi:phage terminase Nu1 subunit (DNA packaging protein)
MSETGAPRQRLLVKPDVMAAIVGLTTRRLEQYVHEGMPKSGREGYPLAAVVQWMI